MKPKGGNIINNRVRLVRQLGQGGMGSVWLGVHLSLDVEVAVKFINPAVLKMGDNLIERFEREAKLAAKLNSPHVVQIFDHGTMNDGTPFIVMEKLRGVSLEHYLLRKGRLGAKETFEIVRQVTKALHEAHEQGVVHRDIKPDNIFLVDSAGDTHAKVLDFGIAKQTEIPAPDQLTGTKVLLGTPEYMSPEQVLSAKAADYQADLWALGVTAYRALVGCMPFMGETMGSLIVAISGAKYQPPSEVVHELSPAVDEWFQGTFSLDHSERHPSALELSQTLGVALGLCEPQKKISKTIATEPHSLHPSSPDENGGKSSSLVTATTNLVLPLNRRNRLIPLALLLSITTVVFFVILREPTPSAPPEQQDAKLAASAPSSAERASTIRKSMTTPSASVSPTATKPHTEQRRANAKPDRSATKQRPPKVQLQRPQQKPHVAAAPATRAGQTPSPTTTSTKKKPPATKRDALGF